MPLDQHDPRWTAYVLGELDAPEQAACETALAADPAARQFVDELRQTLSVLQRGLELEDALPDPLAPAVTLASPPAPAGAGRRWSRWLAALGACLLAGLGVLVSQRGEPELARTSRTSGEQLVPQLGAADEAEAVRELSYRVRPNSDSRAVHESAPELTIPTNPAGSRPLAEAERAARREAGDDSGGAHPALTTAESKSEFERRRMSPQQPGLHRPIALETAESLAPAVDALARSSTRPATPLTPAASAPATELSVLAKERGAVAARTDDFEDELREVRDLDTELNTESFSTVVDNPFLDAVRDPLSTFSIDVDTGSYSILRRFLAQQRQLPPPGSVRIEEMLNYFRYDYPQPQGEVPFSVTTEVASCPWNAAHRLLRIGLKGREVPAPERPAGNLVFLIDVSGSMQDANKLPLVKAALQLLVGQLRENDRVAIVVYAGASGLVLPSTRGDQRETILAALDQLAAGGSTNGGAGIQLAYETAAQSLVAGGVNRVILATDGDFNVGITDRGELVRLIETQARSGVFLTTLGFGMGNLKDDTLEQLADKGNGNYAYIDTEQEARKVLVEQLGGTLVTIAKDVKLQLEFNPAAVAGYRLIGYENRALAAADFNDDQKDAGEIGAGHTVTALYELVPAGQPVPQAAAQAAPQPPAAAPPAPVEAPPQPAVDPLKYQGRAPLTEAAASGELLTLKLRYKLPSEDRSRLLEHVVADSGARYAQASGDFKFASAVALFGMILRQSPHKGSATIDAVLELAQEGASRDDGGYRGEFQALVQQAKELGAR